MTAPARIDAVDALRGLALLAIALVHFSEQFLGAMPPAYAGEYTRHWPSDRILDGIMFALLRGKGFLMFSFLFGVSFYLQMQSAERRCPEGKDYRLRFVWRLAILWVIGLLHSLIYRGDILIIYATLAAPLVLFYKVSSRVLWTVALILIAGGPRMLLGLYAAQTGADFPMGGEQAQLSGAAHWDALKEGDLPRILQQNVADGLKGKANFQLGLAGRGYQTFAVFLIGLSFARNHRFADSPENRLFWRRIRIRCGALTALPILGGLIYAIATSLGNPNPATGEPINDEVERNVAVVETTEDGTAENDEASNNGPQMSVTSPATLIGFGLYDLWNFVMTLFYAGVFYWLYYQTKLAGFLSRFQAVGKTALTSYVTQSIVGLLVFSGIGLGLLGEIGVTMTTLVCVVVFALQILVSQLWLKRFRYGPLEWVWRSLTLRKVIPIQHRSQ